MVKPVLEPLNPYNNNSFLIRTFHEEEFSAPYHFHPEYELTLILKGEGYRYIGNHMAAYSTGDLLLLGPNLPHCWKTETVIKEEINASAIVIQFKQDFLGNDFFTRPELSPILHLLQRSSSGIQFLNTTAEAIKTRMMELAEEDNTFRKLILLLEILQVVAVSREYSVLDQQAGNIQQPAIEQERINAVTGYIVDNFRNEVLLDKAASIANMTTNAFCKYYKKITRKTFMETVIDYRINYAIQQLLHSDSPVSDICFDSGFGDLSNFNKLFKRRMKMSPLQYRVKFMKDI